MPLAEAFAEITDSLPSDWTDLELDLRIDEERYDWHFRLIVAHNFGHAAAAEAVHGTLALLDEAGIAGEIALREVRTGRVETIQDWGRPESFRQEFRRLRRQ
jgi:hypothetical protein